ncbi:hypothetical protein H4219_004084 [Mycoemilia scoparia]|uniref:Uncharacterized protein n=1 Tax=Mycoemilia scoparia TaxID=417184 RepID=A0A9W8DND9_9FUNG|nr:hypothetical protein H4219_004084 [Mycoemilia scoparia]
MDTLALVNLGDYLHPHSPSPSSPATQALTSSFAPLRWPSTATQPTQPWTKGTTWTIRPSSSPWPGPPLLTLLYKSQYAHDIRGILAGFKDPPLPADTLPQDPFTAFTTVKTNLICYFKSVEHKEDHFHLKELATLCNHYTKLYCLALEEQALVTSNFATAKIQIATAKKWVKLGDHISPWSTLLVWAQTKPRNNKPIVALTPDLTDPCHEVTSDADITAAMGDFYYSMYELTTPDPDALEELLALHRCFLDSCPSCPSAPSLQALSDPLTIEEIEIACC